jgi:secreted trypsin-like serine protease
VRYIILVFFIISALSCKQRRSAMSSSFVVGGDEATEGQFAASVHIPNCSATRIGPKHLLTAAHCVLEEF